MALRDELQEVARDKSRDLLERSVEVLGIVTEALASLHVEPVLVGGMAVFFWTADEAFTSYDIDVVMDEPPAADGVLRGLGLSLAPDGRHWELPGTDVLIELPGRTLPDGAVADVVELPSGRHVRVLSDVDVLIVRLEELMVGPHDDITLQALALIARVRDVVRLETRAEQVGVRALLDRLTPVAHDVAAGRRELPAHDALYDLVRGA